MKKLISILILLFLTTISFAQSSQKDEWMRVQSDDGEFSIEVPTKYGFFYDKDGRSVDHSELTVFNSYFEHTLINFEVFKRRFSEIDEKDQIRALKASTEFLYKQKYKKVESEINKGGFKIEQVAYKGDNQYSVKQYFFSNNYFYVLTASSRLGETPAIRRFLNSLIFKPVGKTSTNQNGTRFSKLAQTPIEFEENIEKVKNDAKMSTNSDPQTEPLFIIYQPITLSSFAPANLTMGGEVNLRITFSEHGQVSKIVVLEKLMPNFRRDVILTVLRMRFLPQEKDGIPMSVAKTIKWVVGGRFN